MSSFESPSEPSQLSSLSLNDPPVVEDRLRPSTPPAPPTDSSSSSLLAQPAMSLSAGADPWADPVVSIPSDAPIPAGSSRDNPWASDEPVSSSSSMLGGGALLSPASGAQGDKVRGALSRSASTGEDYGMVKLGREALRFWSFREGFTNLNNGSFGACPRSVCEAFKTLSDKAEENPDLFRLRTRVTLLAEARSRLSEVLHCSADDLVLIANATTATNAVLRDLSFQANDAILLLSVGYGAVERTVAYVVDSYKAQGAEIKTIVVPVTFPVKDAELVASVTKAIEEAKAEGVNVKIGIVDAITSMPAAVLPWVEIVKVFKQHGVLSLVDGAHAIGQIPLDLEAADPDFFVSNCHKWLYAHRGCAIFYVAKRNQALQRSSLPTSWFYTNAGDTLTPDNNTWLKQWDENGTSDSGSMLSVAAALDFVAKVGGLSRIMSYNHDLARCGGLAAAKILGTELLDAEGGNTACMVNVRIPIALARLGPQSTWYAPKGVVAWMFDTLQAEFKTNLPIVVHDQKVWARFSAQLWLEPGDFEYGARALKELARRVNTGEVTFTEDGMVERDGAKEDEVKVVPEEEALPQPEGAGNVEQVVEVNAD